MGASQVLDRVMRVSPGGANWLKCRFVEYAVPANRSMGIRIDAINDGTVRLRLRDRRRNHNVGGTIHGGVLLAFAETVHGVAVLWHFAPSHHRMVTIRAEMDYLTPARGPLRVAFHLTDQEQDRLARALDAHAPAETNLTSVVTDGAGTHVARLRATYRLTRQGERPASDVQAS